jgi:hypothetical protein
VKEALVVKVKERESVVMANLLAQNKTKGMN